MSFARKLRALMRAPYAILHIETYEERRAVELIHQIAAADQRPVWEWSPTQGFDDQMGEVNLKTAFDSILAAEDTPGVFVFKDAVPLLDDLVIRRRLRELEHGCAASGKTLIFVGPERIEYAELTKEFTRLLMPLPSRVVIKREAEHVWRGGQGVDIDAMVSGAMGLTRKEARRAFHRVAQQHTEAQNHNAPFDIEASILEEKQRLIGSNDALEFFPLGEGLGDVGGLGELKKWLGERRSAFTEEARAFGLPAPKGLLLVGIQGCGKSLTAKAVGRYWGLPLLRLDLGRVFEGRRSPEETLRDALQTSEAISPCVLWLDEIEKGFANDGEGRAIRVLGSLLTWLQEKSAPVFLVATANQVDQLPPELLRKGRFDEIFFVDLPDIHDRKEILKIHLTKRRRAIPDDAIEELAAKCEYFAGAELEQVVVSALYAAFAEKRELTARDMEFAARDIVPLYRTYEEKIKALREWASTRARPAAAKRRVLDFFKA